MDDRDPRNVSVGCIGDGGGVHLARGADYILGRESVLTSPETRIKSVIFISIKLSGIKQMASPYFFDQLSKIARLGVPNRAS